MIDYDLDSNMTEYNNIESTSDKFPMKKCQLPETLENINILCMSSSKKYLYIITDNGEIICLKSDTLNPINESFSITSSNQSNSKPFKEKFTKIWTDRAGNHNIIRYNDKIFYFNILCKKVKEIKSFKDIEICAVGFDDYNENQECTGIFLLADYNNNIYESIIKLEKKSENEYKVKSSIKKLTTLVFDDWDTEEDEEYSEPKPKKYERIYGLKFFKNKKPENTLNMNDSIFYIIFATKTKLYQFTGPGIKNFVQFFERFNENPMLFNDSCKYFPQFHKKNKVFTGSNIDLLYKNDRIEQFGWKTESGFCFSNYNYYDFLPNEINSFIVVPFEKINNKGQKEKGLEPLSVTHTQNHIFILYNDCLTIISKLTSNIIQTIYLQTDFNGIIFDEFAEKNGLILLYSKNGLYKISLTDENKDIWRDYLDSGDYSNAIKWAEGNNKLIRRINRIDAEEDFDKNDFNNSVMKYNLSDEHFEIVCLKYLMKNQYDLLQLYCELYLSDNVDLTNKENLEANFITSMILEQMVINSKIDQKKTFEMFNTYIRTNYKYLKGGSIIGPMLRSYGKMEEFILYHSIIADYETVISYYINRGNIYEALDKLIQFVSYLDDNDKNSIKLLSDIFLDNSHSFFKFNPKESINLIKQKFKDISMEKVIQAIICTMDKEVSYIYQLGQSSTSGFEIPKKEENYQAILKYLKSLIDKKDSKELSNIHNLYIYYLVKGKRNQEALLEYLKKPFKSGDSSLLSKNKVLFQLDYAKKLFENNAPAYALVLALMGKYSEGVQKALSDGDKNGRKIAEFIASNAPGDSLKKQLWIEIFSYINKQHKFQEALAIMKNSKILKIEDVLPHITDTIKIEEFKKQISECIFDYEKNIKKLKDDINNYNKTSKNIKNDIMNLKKRSMEIPFTNYKCQICQNYIKNQDIYLFPCGHMFDANCIREALLKYEATGLEYIHEKNVKIDSLFVELGYVEKSDFDIIGKKEKTLIKIEEEKNQSESQGVASNILNKLKFRRVETVKDRNLFNNIKRRESELQLNKMLSEQCVLCGDYMVDSVQCSISIQNSQKVIGGTKMRIKRSSNWDYYE